MKKIENHCCGCANERYPCLGSSCRNRHVVVYYCDECKCEIDFGDLYEEDGNDLCSLCLLKRHKQEEDLSDD